MGFLTPILLAGTALVAVPVILHLVMRREPRRLEFPALQFIRQRQHANRRRLNLRHWLLLAMRCALVAGLAIALARPTLKGSGLRGKEGAPLAVALVIDNSLRMQYVQDNKTRQQAAMEMAQALVGKLPEETEVAIVELGRASAGFVVDLGTADARLRSLAPAANARPLQDAVREAVQLVGEREEFRQEVFVFSDLSEAAWDDTSRAAIDSMLAEAPEVRMYLVDVGQGGVTNTAIEPLDLRRTTLRAGESLHLRAPISSVGTKEPPLVELYLVDASGQPTKRGQRIVELSADGTGEATFEIGGLALGTHQGFVKLASSDPLEVDNTRYFTLEVLPPAKVLILAQSPQDAVFLREALQPSFADDSVPTGFDCQVTRFADAGEVKFDKFDAICLLDPPPLNDSVWQSLVEYADDGGGIGLFLGHRARPAAFNSSAAAQLLPGELKLRSRYETYLRPRGLDHPALSGLQDYSEQIPWQVFYVWQFWEFDTPAGDSYIVAHFDNSRPALFERSVGRGRVMTFATPISDPLEPKDREPWNLLPTGPEPWPFLALTNQMVGHLARRGNDQLSFNAGETVNLQLSGRQQVSSYALYLPDGESVRRTLPPGDDTIRIGTTDQLGNYRIASGGESRQLDMGFSVNPRGDVSQLTRIDPDTLLAELPKKQVELATTFDDVERYVDVGRSGRELFPWAISLVALVWGAEHMLSNRFYREAT